VAKVFLGSNQPFTRIYVATDGDDIGGDGSIGLPLKTLEGARDKIRGMARPLANKVDVVLRGGEYRLSTPFVLGPQDSGEKQSEITYKSYPGEKATLLGSSLASGTWNNEGGGLWSLNLSGRVKFQTLWINGKRKERARFPKEKDYYVQGELPPRTEPVYDHIVRDPNRTAPTGITAQEIAAGDVEVIDYMDYQTERHKLDPDDPGNPTWLMMRGLIERV